MVFSNRFGIFISAKMLSFGDLIRQQFSFLFFPLSTKLSPIGLKHKLELFEKNGVLHEKIHCRDDCGRINVREGGLNTYIKYLSPSKKRENTKTRRIKIEKPNGLCFFTASFHVGDTDKAFTELCFG